MRPRKTERRPRRSPAEARELILNAAERVFRSRLPDSVGLKEVAREAGVSHPLLSHYFGTYQALVDATLARRVDGVRANLISELMHSLASSTSVLDVIAAYGGAIERATADAVTVRLILFAVLTGRFDETDIVSGRVESMSVLADVLVAKGGGRIGREELEFSLLASFAMSAVWSVAKRPLMAALGRKYTKQMDVEFAQRLRTMIAAFLGVPSADPEAKRPRP